VTHKGRELPSKDLDALPQNIDVTSSGNSGKGNAEATRVINFGIHFLSKFAIAVKPELSLWLYQRATGLKISQRNPQDFMNRQELFLSML
jgi:hypothetical protein